jgi:hypothetical protein
MCVACVIHCTPPPLCKTLGVLDLNGLGVLGLVFRVAAPSDHRLPRPTNPASAQRSALITSLAEPGIG